MAICASCGSMNDDLAQTCLICGQQILSTRPAPGSSQDDPSSPYADRVDPNPFPFGSQQSFNATPDPVYAAYPVSTAVPSQSTTGPLPMIGMVMGIVILCVSVIGLIPCLGWLNWITVTLGPVTGIMNLVAIILENVDSNKRSKAVIGLVLALVAVVVGGFRLVLGAGCV